MCVWSLYNKKTSRAHYVVLCGMVIECFIHHQHKHTSKFINTPVNPLVFIIEQWNFAVSVTKSCWKHPYIFFWLEVWGRHELDHPFIRHAFDEYIMHSWNASDNKHVCKNIFSGWSNVVSYSAIWLGRGVVTWVRCEPIKIQRTRWRVYWLNIGISIWPDDSSDLIEKSCFPWPRTWERFIFLTSGKMNYSYYA